MGYSRGCEWEKYLYRIIVLFIALWGLGLGQPEVKPSTSEPLPARLKAEG